MDALFRVRAAPKRDIAQVIKGTSSRIVPINQGTAMQQEFKFLSFTWNVAYQAFKEQEKGWEMIN